MNFGWRIAMQIARRRFLRLAGAAVAVPAVPHLASAQGYPSRPVKLIVGNAAGGLNDILARLIGQWLSERLGQPFVIENRPGAGGNIATEAVANAPADGHTLLLTTIANAVNAALFARLSHNFIRDIAPVASIVREPLFMVVPQSFPAKSVPEFVAYAKANPRSLNMASPGNGTAPHVAGELFKMIAGVNMAHVPYSSGATALTDLLSGQVQVFFTSAAVSLEQIKAGKLRALAVTSAMPSVVLPELPTLSEFVPGYDVSTWFGIGAPKSTPTEIVDRLNKEINAGLADPKLKARFTELGSSAFVGSPADFGKFIADETDKWAKVVKFAGLKTG
jgi:tripartite-type tricarboxylate transporter receptor subunit TctC